MEPYIVHVTSKGSRLFLILDEDEIRLKKTDTGNLPVFTEKSSCLNLIGSFKGPHDLARNTIAT